MSKGIEIIARGILVHRGSVLLCMDNRSRYMYLPGGHVEVGEPAADALRREFLEECGLELTVGDCLLVTEELFTQGSKRRHEVNLVFHVEHGDPPDEVRSLEADISFAWVDLAATVDLDIRPYSARAWLASGGRDHPTASWLPACAKADL